MFTKERNELLTISFNFNFDKYSAMAKQHKQFESTLDSVHSSIESLRASGKEYSDALGMAEYGLNLQNSNNVRRMFIDLRAWITQYKMLLETKKITPKAFEDKMNSDGFKLLVAYNDKFSKYVSNEENFSRADDFVKKFMAQGKLTEANVKAHHNFVEQNKKVLLECAQYIPANVTQSIKEINNLYAMVIEVERMNKDTKAFIDKWWYLVKNPDTNKADVSSLQDVINRSKEYIAAFDKLTTAKTLQIADVFDKKHRSSLQSIISAAEQLIEQDRISRAQRAKGMNTRKIISKILGVILALMCGAVVIVTIIKNCILFAGSKGIFWAILFGIITGILYGVFRLAVLLGMGSVWWPSCLSTLIYSSSSDKISVFMVIFNVVFLLVCYSYLYLGRYRAKYDDEGSATDQSGYIMTMPVIGMIAFIIRIVWSGIIGLLALWESVWGIISVVCGIGLGLFRCVMLIIGAGYWWPGLFQVTANSGAILNTALYILIVYIIVIWCTADKD